MQIKHCTYTVTWLPEDNEHLGLCAEFPSLSWLAKTPEAALKGVGKAVAKVVVDMRASGEPVPAPMAEKHYSGESGCVYRHNFTAIWHLWRQSKVLA